MNSIILLSFLIFAAAIIYSSVGHGGASGYLAAMALVGIAPDVMKPTALALNILVSSIAFYHYLSVKAFDWKIFWPLMLTSIPMAYLGGMINLPEIYYKPLVGLVLIYAAFYSYQRSSKTTSYKVRSASVKHLLPVGVLLGFLSGLTGVGGGIFLSPLLLFTRWAAIRSISGIAALFILVNSVAGLSGYLMAGHTMPAAVPWWILASVLGGLIGARFGSKRFSNPIIQKILALVLLIAGVKMVLTSF
ncbi:MAG: sulfite exporter TauE/SafE family protein [Gammaproteobacteria bacterium]|nr:sulfite exporter TauE/SafE family protein [Gammaproteobacteria bacterium]MDH5629511.1 sulfite exporter TauE/SafE family protein [Gammaproteobacteria bacterium]